MAGEGDDIDVLVVGAGPSGLLLASELSRRGVRTRIIDKLLVPSDKSRALVVQARTTEIFEQMGLAERLIAAGSRIERAKFFIDGREAVELHFADIRIEGAPYPFLLNVAQDDTERVLSEHLTSLGGTIERGVELTSVQQSDPGVRSELRHADGRTETVRSRFICGCDGAHSTVRHQLGMPFEGAPYEQDFILADVDVSWDVPRDEMRIFVSKDGVFAVFPLKGGKRTRLLASRRKVDAAAGAPDLAEFQQTIDRFSPVPARLSNPHWLARFRLSHRLVKHYSSGAAFLCGDAAHIHSPAGGQGMNTGLQDAWNLAWKMALVVQGQASPSLLESYHRERYPVGEFLMKTTDRLFQMATGGGMVLDFTRRHVAPALAKAAIEHQAVRRFALMTLSQLGVEYRKSPIVGEVVGTNHVLGKEPLPGDRAPDAAVTDGAGRPTRLFLQMGGPRFHALLFAAGAGSAELLDLRRAYDRELQAKCPGLVDVLTIFRGASAEGLLDSAGYAHSRYGAAAVAQYLIRPDGYIGWRAAGWDVSGLLGHLRSTLGR